MLFSPPGPIERFDRPELTTEGLEDPVNTKIIRLGSDHPAELDDFLQDAGEILRPFVLSGLLHLGGL